MALSLFRKKIDSFDFTVPRSCRVCNNEFKGRYCNLCGEKVTEPHERSIVNFLHSLLNAFTFLDGKFINSLKLLVMRPGELSKNISNGQRVPFMSMVSLFFVTNFFYFFFPVFDSYNSSLQTQLNFLGNHSVHAKEIVREYVIDKKLSSEDFEKQYNNQSTNLSKTLIIILVIMLAFVSAIVNYSKSKFFIDHILFSLEFYSFQILINLVILANAFWYLIKLVALWGWNWSVLLSDNAFTILGTVTLVYWLVSAEKKFFEQKWYWAIPKAILLITLMVQSVDLYRKMLFYITINTL